MNLRDLAAEQCIGEIEPVRVSEPHVARRPRTLILPPARSIGRDARPEVELYLFPNDGDYGFVHNVLPSAVAKVDAIREQALALNWNERRLYQNRGRYCFPYGEDYGLVCFIGEAERIAEVTKQYIEIVNPPPRENRLQFYNPDVPQPWRAVHLSLSISTRGLSPMTEKSRRAPGRS